MTNEIKKTALFCGVLTGFLCTALHADIYRCVSDDGVTTYSDQPCGNQTELVYNQPATSVDDALRVTIDPFLRPYTSDSYDAYIIAQAQRIGRAIFPDKWFNASEIIRVRGPSPRDSYSKPKPKPKYGTVPGWVIFLYYGPREAHRKWTVQFHYLSLVRKDINDVSQSIVKLKSISIKKDGRPFTPESMNDISEVTLAKPGDWVAKP